MQIQLQQARFTVLHGKMYSWHNNVPEYQLIKLSILKTHILDSGNAHTTATSQIYIQFLEGQLQAVLEPF